jgi:hypothetical protein
MKGLTPSKLKFHRKREIKNGCKPSCYAEYTEDRCGYLFNRFHAHHDCSLHWVARIFTKGCRRSPQGTPRKARSRARK